MTRMTALAAAILAVSASNALANTENRTDDVLRVQEQIEVKEKDFWKGNVEWEFDPKTIEDFDGEKKSEIKTKLKGNITPVAWKDVFRLDYDLMYQLKNDEELFKGEWKDWKEDYSHEVNLDPRFYIYESGPVAIQYTMKTQFKRDEYEVIHEPEIEYEVNDRLKVAFAPWIGEKISKDAGDPREKIEGFGIVTTYDWTDRFETRFVFEKEWINDKADPSPDPDMYKEHLTVYMVETSYDLGNGWTLNSDVEFEFFDIQDRGAEEYDDFDHYIQTYDIEIDKRISKPLSIGVKFEYETVIVSDGPDDGARSHDYALVTGVKYRF